MALDNDADVLRFRCNWNCHVEFLPMKLFEGTKTSKKMPISRSSSLTSEAQASDCGRTRRLSLAVACVPFAREIGAVSELGSTHVRPRFVQLGHGHAPLHCKPRQRERAKTNQDHTFKWLREHGKHLERLFLAS